MDRLGERRQESVSARENVHNRSCTVPAKLRTHQDAYSYEQQIARIFSVIKERCSERATRPTHTDQQDAKEYLQLRPIEPGRMVPDDTTQCASKEQLSANARCVATGRVSEYRKWVIEFRETSTSRCSDHSGSSGACRSGVVARVLRMWEGQASGVGWMCGQLASCSKSSLRFLLAGADC